MKTDISYLKISDITLVNAVNKLVKDEENTDTSKNNFFRAGYGYISLQVKEYSQSDTLIKYNINPELISIKEDSPDNLYPDYYSFINKRLVLITLTVLNKFSYRNFSERSKALIRKLVNKQLQKTKKVTFHDISGKKTFTDKKFRIDYVKFDAGTSIYILKDKSAIIKHDR